jgi:CBS domain-containing protein
MAAVSSPVSAVQYSRRGRDRRKSYTLGVELLTMLVRDVMSTNVVTVDANATVRDALGRMLEAGIGSVVATKEDNPAGILRNVDVLRIGHEHDRPLSEIPVYAATSRPLVTTRSAPTWTPSSTPCW